MTADQHIREGNLEDALALLLQQVRKDPANAKYRVFLFQLAAVLGDYDRALNQLTIAGELDAINLAMSHAYREAIQCEVLRAHVFNGTKTPLIFGEPQQWLALLLESLKLSALKKPQEAKAMRQQALDDAPATSGTINGEAFNWIADADNRLGPVLEVLLNGRYYWIPFNHIKKIQIEAPSDLRDLVWLPAHFIWTNEGEAFGFIPSRYPGSEKSADSAIRMARKTEWQETEEGIALGLGQRLFATDVNDYSLLDVRELLLNAD